VEILSLANALSHTLSTPTDIFDVIPLVLLVLLVLLLLSRCCAAS
jgi:hypothetical protein